MKAKANPEFTEYGAGQWFFVEYEDGDTDLVMLAGITADRCMVICADGGRWVDAHLTPPVTLNQLKAQSGLKVKVTPVLDVEIKTTVVQQKTRIFVNGVRME